MNAELSPRQAELLAFLRRFHGENGYMPTVREMCLGLGMTLNNVSAVSQHLKALAEKGHIERQKGRSRALVLSSAPSAFLAGGGVCVSVPCRPLDASEARRLGLRLRELAGELEGGR